MQSTSSSSLPSPPSWGVIERYRGMIGPATRNANPDNWEWEAKGWELADDSWQKFKKKWYGTLQDPEARSMSLEPLPLPAGGSSSSILIRESYVKTFDHVWARAMSSQRTTGAVITGQPGIGKTIFQYYLLTRLLQNRQIVLFSTNGADLFLFYHDQVYVPDTASVQSRLQLPRIKSSPTNIAIWSLFDIEKQTEPEGLLVKKNCFLVQTASPDPIRYQSWVKARSAMIIGLPLWTCDELAQGLPYRIEYQSMFNALGDAPSQIDPLDVFPGARELLKKRSEDGVSLTPSDALDCLLEAATDRFGHSARDVFDAVFNYKSITRRHERAFKIDYAELLAAVTALATNTTSNSEISNRILALSPDDEEPFVSVNWKVDFKSDWVARSVIKQLDNAQDLAVCQQLDILNHIPQAKSMAGWFLAPAVHRAITETKGDFWPLSPMSFHRMDSPQFSISQDSLSRISNDLRFPKAKREVVQFHSIDDLSTDLKDNAYYIPLDSTFPLFDAFAIDLDLSEKSAILWILQITTSRSHGGSSIGYQKIREIIAILKDKLRGDSPAMKKRKVAGQITSESVEVHYLLVVPKSDSENTKWQFPKGWSKNCTRHDHRGDVHCLQVPV